MKTFEGIHKKCPRCGTLFVPAPEHIFRDGPRGKYYCGWNCYAAAKKAGKIAERKTIK